MSQITTHVLDTSIGKPAEGISITLSQFVGSDLKELTNGVTNSDGRVANFLPSEKVLDAGRYLIKFEIADYFEKTDTKAFYPYVEIVFEIDGDGDHYHVPLLLNPFGYSTYRGS